MITTFIFATVIQASSQNYLSDIVKEMKKTWPNNRLVEIVCHGHSVPAGYFKTPDVQVLNAYPAILREGLAARFPNSVFNVSVTAIGGENSISGERRFAQDVLSRHPDVVSIDYGLNDRGLNPSSVRSAWTSMITQAKSKNIKVLLLTPTPDQSAKMDNPADPLNQQATAIRQLAVEQGVGLVDSLEVFQQAIKKGNPLPTLMSQVNHPNRKGHELVAAEILKWFPTN